MKKLAKFEFEKQIDINNNTYIVKMRPFAYTDDSLTTPSVWDAAIRPKDEESMYGYGEVYAKSADEALKKFLVEIDETRGIKVVEDLVKRYENFLVEQSNKEKRYKEVEKKRELPTNGPVKKFTPEEIERYQTKGSTIDFRKRILARLNK